MFSGHTKSQDNSLIAKGMAVYFAALFILALWPGDQAIAKGDKFCSTTARNAFTACNYETKDDFWIGIGKCNNIADQMEREECIDEAKDEYQESKELCKEQRYVRLEICDVLGESPYDPEISPEDFVDFEEVIEGGDFTPNPYFPLVPGTIWHYEAVDADGEVFEKIKVEVLAETKEILGVNCLVVRDRVWEIDEGDEVLIEDTFDWYAQDKNAGNVWYFGEIARNYEDGELVDLEGSWKAGKDGAKAGIVIPAVFTADDMYRQEFLLGEAEDMAEVVGIVNSLTVRNVSYANLAQTREFSPLEPDVEEFKYYAPGVGLVLEENLEDEERVELVEMTTP